MKQRLISLLLVLCLLAAVPMTGFADDAQTLNALALQGKPAGLTLTAEGGILITDTFNHIIWLLDSTGFSPVAGELTGTNDYREPVGGYQDGDRVSALFCNPWAITPFLDGYAVSDRGNNAIRLVTDDKVQTVLLASATDNVTTATGLATDDEGNLYFSDSVEGRLWKMTEKGVLSLYAEGLHSPMGLCWMEGTLYVAETGKNRISAIADGEVIPICGSGEDGFRDGRSSKAEFSAPQTVTAGPDGTLYIADTGNGAVRAYCGGIVTTVMQSDGQFWGVSPCGLLVKDGLLLGADSFGGGLFYRQLEEASYGDISSEAWYAGDVSTVSALGLMKGTDKGFEPDGTLTRAMLAQILLNAAKMQDRNLIVYGKADFTDVQESDWFCSAVGWAQQNGLVSGVGSGSFLPQAAATRQELAVMLYRAQEEQGDPGALEGFRDADEVSSWAVDAMCWAVQKGIIQGSDGCLNPTDPVKRAEAAAMLVRFYAK